MPDDVNESIASPAEFAKIPLDFIIATPLLTTIEAHKVAAMTTLEFVKALNGSPNLDLKIAGKTVDAAGAVTSQERSVSVPLLVLAKVPSLNFDSLSVGFKFNVSQVVTEKKSTTSGAEAKLNTK